MCKYMCAQLHIYIHVHGTGPEQLQIDTGQLWTDTMTLAPWQIDTGQLWTDTMTLAPNVV